MAGPLWSEARDALAGVAEIASKYDTDGIDIYFLWVSKLSLPSLTLA